MNKKDILQEVLKKYIPSYGGHVYNRKNNRIVKQATDSKGYKYFTCYMGKGKSKKIKVHRLVAYHYIPNPDNLPYVNHKDGNRSNNWYTNLEWCTMAYNVQDGFKRGRIIWNKGNASKERIFGYCKKYPRQIFWILTKDDFHFAKAFWGEEIVHKLCGNVFVPFSYFVLDQKIETTCCETCDDDFDSKVERESIRSPEFEEPRWQWHLKRMVLKEDPILYLEQFLDS